MYITPILAVSYFTKNFILECDAFNKGIGVVSTQEGWSLVLTSKQLWDKNLGKSTYEKKLWPLFTKMILGSLT